MPGERLGLANAEADTIAFTDIVTGETKTIIYHEDLGWDVGGSHASTTHRSGAGST